MVRVFALQYLDIMRRALTLDFETLFIWGKRRSGLLLPSLFLLSSLSASLILSLFSLLAFPPFFVSLFSTKPFPFSTKRRDVKKIYIFFKVKQNYTHN